MPQGNSTLRDLVKKKVVQEEVRPPRLISGQPQVKMEEAVAVIGYCEQLQKTLIFYCIYNSVSLR